MNLTIPPVSLTNPRQGKLAAAAEPKLVLEWQDGLATDLGFRQQKMRLSFARGPISKSEGGRRKAEVCPPRGTSHFALRPSHFLCAVIAIAALTLSACKKGAVQSQAPLPVNVITVEEREVQDWVEFTDAWSRWNPSRLACVFRVTSPR